MYKFIDDEGRESSLSDAYEWLSAVRDGRVKASTLVFDPSESRWKEARETDAFEVAMASLNPPATAVGQEESSDRARLESTAPSVGEPAPAFPKASRQHGWQGVLYYWLSYIGAGVLGILALGVAAVLLDEGADAAIALFVFIFFGGLAALSFCVARGVEQFRPWARVVALVLGYMSVVAGFLSLLYPDGGAERLGAILSGVLAIIFIAYFHAAKELFVEDWNREGVGHPERTDAVEPGIGAQSPSQTGFAVAGARDEQGGEDLERAVVEIRCRECGNGEEMRVNSLYDRREYRNFMPREGFWTGRWTLTCLKCRCEMPYDPYKQKADAMSR